MPYEPAGHQLHLGEENPTVWIRKTTISPSIILK
jgi:hypothetical protein